jgi:hypothetical protein
VLVPCCRHCNSCECCLRIGVDSLLARLLAWRAASQPCSYEVLVY